MEDSAVESVIPEDTAYETLSKNGSSSVEDEVNALLNVNRGLVNQVQQLRNALKLSNRLIARLQEERQSAADQLAKAKVELQSVRDCTPKLLDDVCSVRHAPTDHKVVVIGPRFASRLRLRSQELDDVYGSEISAVTLSSGSTAEYLTNATNVETDSATATSSDQELNSTLKAKLMELNHRCNYYVSLCQYLELSLAETNDLNAELSSACCQLESNQCALRSALSFEEKALELARLLLTLNTMAKNDDQRAHVNQKKSHESNADVCDDAVGCAAGRVKATTADCGEFEEGSTPVDQGQTPPTNPDLKNEYLNIDEVQIQRMIDDFEARKRRLCKSVVAVHCPTDGSRDRLPNKVRNVAEEMLKMENAVLLQELMTLKEEVNAAKARLYFLDKEKVAVSLSLASKHTEMETYQALCAQLHQQLVQNNESKEDSSSSVNENHFVLLKKTARNILTQWKESVESLKIGAELQTRQLEETIDDLKETNVLLLESLKKCRKRHRKKLSKLRESVNRTSEYFDSQLLQMKRHVENCLESGRGNKAMF